MRKRLPLIAGLVVAALVLAFVMRGRHSTTETKPEPAPAISVKTVTVSASQIPNDMSASGTVRPIVESKIAPKIMSNVAAVYVREGDHVRAGQVLIRLESRDLQAQLAQAEAGLNAAAAGSGRAYTAIDLQKAQTSTGIASAEAGLKAAREQLSLVKAGPRKQQRVQAHLVVAQAQAQFKNAEIELNRYKRLYEQDVVPKQRLDGVQTSYDIAKAQLESAQEQASLTEEGSRTQEIQSAQQQVRQAEEALRMARASAVQDKMSVSNARVASSQVSQARAGVEFARTQLGYATIISPISGVVSQRMVDPGDTVSPGVPVISVQADSNYRLEATVPESSAANIFVGKRVNVSIGADNRTAVGTVAVVSPAGDPTSHKFVVKVELPATLKARSGEFGRISFPIGYSKGVIVPEVAIHNEGGLPILYIVGEKNRARMQVVKVGRKTDSGVEILSGLTDGDRVIVGNTGVLSDGVSVRIEGK
ncbi:MAG: efflux RND transporter periplasmic adaptor subunit [Armatimonadetes bacterium]|nr:efflux RND transporter periplasmic adaptor subunit [Armatimonadota bacterium]